MNLNTSKCKCLHIGKPNPKKQYTINGHLLESMDSEKDLGVIMDSELKFHIHTSSAIKKANKILGLIKKTVANLDANTLPLHCMGHIKNSINKQLKWFKEEQPN